MTIPNLYYQIDADRSIGLGSVYVDHEGIPWWYYPPGHGAHQVDNPLDLLAALQGQVDRLRAYEPLPSPLSQLPELPDGIVTPGLGLIDRQHDRAVLASLYSDLEPDWLVIYRIDTLLPPDDRTLLCRRLDPIRGGADRLLADLMTLAQGREP